MFTGLVEETGIIKRIEQLPDGKRFHIQAIKVCDDLKIDDSIAVNGVCLTVTNVQSEQFSATAVHETLERSTLEILKAGTIVNLERALKASSRLGGHWVQGHVDTIGKVYVIQQMGTGWMFSIAIPEDMLKYCVEKGSITVDGISLTIASISEEHVTVAVIPHTFENTVMRKLQSGSAVNIEVDILAKYVERMLVHHQNNTTHDESWYRSHGY